jgi:hypothetical protein
MKKVQRRRARSGDGPGPFLAGEGVSCYILMLGDIIFCFCHVFGYFLSMEFSEWWYTVMEVKTYNIFMFGTRLVQDLLCYDKMIMFCNNYMNGFMGVYDSWKCLYFGYAKDYYAMNLSVWHDSWWQSGNEGRNIQGLSSCVLTWSTSRDNDFVISLVACMIVRQLLIHVCWTYMPQIKNTHWLFNGYTNS